MREEKIKRLLDTILAEDKFSSYFLVALRAPDQSHRIQVFLDGDEGISYNICKLISRKLEEVLDEAEWVPDKYILEVSSPGVDRSLEILRQFKQHKGRDLKIIMKSGDKRHGELLGVEGNKIILNEEKTIKRGKSREDVIEKVRIDFDAVEETKVKISFNR